MKIIKIGIFLLLFCNVVKASDSLSTQNDRKKRYIIAGTEAFCYAASYSGLGVLWYSDYPKSDFHFKNDIHEWMRMDKFGHAFSGYWISRGNYELFKWANFSDNKAIMISMASSWLYMSTIEVFDGFSSQYGASQTDILANTLGTTLFGFQQYFWKEQKILYKFCFYPSPYAKYRPDEFGTNYMNNLLKDYNGQIYWFSTGIQNLTGVKAIPQWLNIAVGFGAHGMTGGYENYKEVVNGLTPIPNSERARQIYFSFDINMEKIKTKNKVLKATLLALNAIKFPLPTIQINRSSTKIVIR